MMRTFRVVVLLALLGVSPARARSLGEDLDLSAGTLQLGGSIGFSVSAAFGEERADRLGSSNTVGYGVWFSPWLGYFPVEGLEVFGGPEIDGHLGQRWTDSWQLGFSLGLRYCFVRAPVVKPFLGVGLGMEFNVSGGSSADDLLYPFLQAGILIGLTPYLALEIGMWMTLTIYYNDSQKPILLDASLGYLGVSAFF